MDTHAQTIIIVTHNPIVAATADFVVFLVNGQIRNVRKNPTVSEINSQIIKWES
ncbi:MAG: hypothetical protein FWG68_07225 [Defluviitaleaceae bacterium]|nr:hypothetical protein [Defluviitaleaceae bacterium]